ncbi:nitrite reductase (NAD(P)H) small subunit [Actinacidiphila yeochonensis]|uniref:nitrite reductase (NAD(P)H) small subunit n=1 Tax=Actinacidiphila yeochonensis TaxID=89050 RepID=UPI00099C8291|nr:nitrite reductase (NAD(P)H) small subunit [Actinacidiphila yeochonensis]
MSRTVELFDGTAWTPVCDQADLVPGRGVAVLTAGGEQVAVFLDRAGGLHALDNRDPFSGAYVISRGILGSRGDAPTVASPMYKQVFDLRDGRCLDEETAPDGTPAVLRVWPVRGTAAEAPRPAPRPAPAQPSQPAGA